MHGHEQPPNKGPLKDTWHRVRVVSYIRIATVIAIGVENCDREHVRSNYLEADEDVIVGIHTRFWLLGRVNICQRVHGL